MHERMVVSHPPQFALSKGAQRAISCISRHAECVLSRITEVWAISIDITKMFNMHSLNTALRVAHCMGLDEECCQQLRGITGYCNKGAWRMPGNVAVPHFRRTKGLPQRMAMLCQKLWWRCAWQSYCGPCMLSE